MKDSESLAHGSRCYEYIRIMDDMNNFQMSTQSTRCYEQIRAMNDMNEFML